MWALIIDGKVVAEDQFQQPLIVELDRRARDAGFAQAHIVPADQVDGPWLAKR